MVRQLSFGRVTSIAASGLGTFIDMIVLQSSSVASLAGPAGLGAQLRSRARERVSLSSSGVARRGGRAVLSAKNQAAGGNGNNATMEAPPASKPAGVVGLKLSPVFNEVLAEEIANQGEGSVQKVRSQLFHQSATLYHMYSSQGIRGTV